MLNLIGKLSEGAPGLFGKKSAIYLHEPRLRFSQKLKGNEPLIDSSQTPPGLGRRFWILWIKMTPPRSTLSLSPRQGEAHPGASRISLCSFLEQGQRYIHVLFAEAQKPQFSQQLRRGFP